MGTPFPATAPVNPGRGRTAERRPPQPAAARLGGQRRHARLERPRLVRRGRRLQLARSTRRLERGGDGAASGRRPGTAAPAPVHGVAPDGTVFDGTFTLRRFVDKRGVLYAVGRLEGQLGDRAVRDNVRLPINGATNALPGEGLTGPTGLMSPEQVVPTPGACDLLTLNLGPLDLDLLGLRVALDDVNLLLEAVPGAGNLLGNLLCAVAGLLDGGFLGGLLSNLLASITALLNGLLGNV